MLEFTNRRLFYNVNSKFSLIIIDDMVIFSNSIGDITAVDIETGLIHGNFQLKVAIYQ